MDALFAAAGVRVVPVEDFEHRVAWVQDLGLLIIDSRLGPEERHLVAQDYLPAVLGWSG